MLEFEGLPISAGSDAYWHVYVYGGEFSDGSRFTTDEGRLILIDHEDVIPEDAESDEVDLIPPDLTLFYPALVEAVSKSFGGKTLKTLRFQIVGEVEPGQEVDCSTFLPTSS